MDRLIYTTLTGLSARGREQIVTANNLANAGTTGFRREVTEAEGRYFAGLGVTSRVQSGAPSVATPQDPGKIEPTGRDMDIAMGGDAWLAVQGPVINGLPSEAYTRRGDLSVSASGVLQNGDGRAVIGQAGQPITIPAGAALSIASDGSLFTKIGDEVANIGRIKLVNGTSLADSDKAGDGLFEPKSPLAADPTARVTTGALENSNVKSAGALAELIEQSRGFEVNARLLGIAKDIDERTAKLMSIDAQ